MDRDLYRQISQAHHALAERWHKLADSNLDDSQYQAKLLLEIHSFEATLHNLKAHLAAPIPEEPSEPEEPTEPGEPEPLPEPNPGPGTCECPQQEKGFFVISNSQAHKKAEELRLEHNDTEADLIDKIATRSNAFWYNGIEDREPLRAVVRAANSARLHLVVVLYDVPDRDSGQHSAGGAEGLAKYKESVGALRQVIEEEWTNDLATLHIVIEPDALNLPDSLSDERVQALHDASWLLAGLAETEGVGWVESYLDIGHSNWRSPEEIAERLRKVNIPSSMHLASNVSSFQPTSRELEYQRKVHEVSGLERKILIDTSRNGANKVQDEWCNPWDVVAGQAPEKMPETTLVGVKLAAESDGNCNGGPNAGEWFHDWAIAFVRRSESAGTL